jgi:hypothetical protein
MLRGVGERTGRAVDQLVADLEVERSILTATPVPQLPSIDFDAMRPIIESRVLEMREALASAPEERRAAFRTFLAGRRMRVFPDEEQRFWVEGLFELCLETPDAQAHEGSGRRRSLVAGARSVRVPTCRVQWPWAA